MARAPTHRVLVVDDDDDVREAHARLVRSLGYDTETAIDGVDALGKLSLDIDLVLLDGDMPTIDGFEVARRIRSSPDHSHLPIIMVTGLTHREDRRRAMELGVNDFVHKPIDHEELALRARWLLELKSAYDRLKGHKEELERAVERRTSALRSALDEMAEAKRLTHDAHLDTIRRLTIAAEYRDTDTAGHIERIGVYSQRLAQALGRSPTEVETIRHAAPMHDVGKIGIPDRVLLKPGPLDDAEWQVMRSHTTIGAQILTGSTSRVIEMGERIALTHHERFDGTGYPRAIGGEEIPIEGRICAVVDFFDALTTDRPYRRALPRAEVIEMMRERRATHFDPQILDAFLDVAEDIVPEEGVGPA